MDKRIIEKLIDTAVKKNSSKFVGNSSDRVTIDFHFRPMVSLLKFEKSAITTIR